MMTLYLRAAAMNRIDGLSRCRGCSARSRIAGAVAAAIRAVRSTGSTTAGAIVWIGLFFACGAFAQSDAELFAEGRVAFDKYKDCAAAEKALTAVSADGQNSPLWLSYMARTEECLGKIQAAISYFERYDRAVPGQVEIINKLADLRYQVSKMEQRTEEQARLLRLQAEERARLLLLQRAEREQKEKERADALLTLTSDSETLASLVNDHPPNPEASKHKFSFKASTSTSCKLQIETGEEFFRSLTIIDFSRARASATYPFETPQCDTCGVHIGCASTTCVNYSTSIRKAILGARFEPAANNDVDQFSLNLRTAEQAQQVSLLLKRVITACSKP
jgi:hypothetical protein